MAIDNECNAARRKRRGFRLRYGLGFVLPVVTVVTAVTAVVVATGLTIAL